MGGSVESLQQAFRQRAGDEFAAVAAIVNRAIHGVDGGIIEAVGAHGKNSRAAASRLEGK